MLKDINEKRPTRRTILMSRHRTSCHRMSSIHEPHFKLLKYVSSEKIYRTCMLGCAMADVFRNQLQFDNGCLEFQHRIVLGSWRETECGREDGARFVYIVSRKAVTLANISATDPSATICNVEINYFICLVGASQYIWFHLEKYFSKRDYSIPYHRAVFYGKYSVMEVSLTAWVRCLRCHWPDQGTSQLHSSQQRQTLPDMAVHLGIRC